MFLLFQGGISGSMLVFGGVIMANVSPSNNKITCCLSCSLRSEQSDPGFSKHAAYASSAASCHGETQSFKQQQDKNPLTYIEPSHSERFNTQSDTVVLSARLFDSLLRI